MANEIPFGVKYAGAINVITIIVLIVPGLLFAAIGVPNLLKATNIKIYFHSPIIRLLVFISFLSIGLIPAYLLTRPNVKKQLV